MADIGFAAISGKDESSTVSSKTSGGAPLAFMMTAAVANANESAEPVKRSIPKPVAAKNENLLCDLASIYMDNNEFSLEELRAQLPKYDINIQPHESPRTTRNADHPVDRQNTTTKPTNPVPKSMSVPIQDDNNPFEVSGSLATVKSGITANNDDDDDDDEGLPSRLKGRSAKSRSMASPTINTKAALADVFEMFNAPLPGENDEPGSETVSSHSNAQNELVEDDNVVQQSVRVERKPHWYDVESDETISAKVYKAPVTKLKVGVFRDDEDRPTKIGEQPAKLKGILRDARQQLHENISSSSNPQIAAAGQPSTCHLGRKPLGAKPFLAKSPVVDDANPFLDNEHNPIGVGSLIAEPHYDPSSKHQVASQNNPVLRDSLVIDTQAPLDDGNKLTPTKTAVGSKVPYFNDFENFKGKLIDENCHDDEDDEDEDGEIKFPSDLSPRRVFPQHHQHRMQMGMREFMTPITEASYEGDRTMAGLSTIGSIRYGDIRSSLGGVTLTSIINTSAFKDDSSGSSSASGGSKRYSLLKGLQSDDGVERTLGENTLSSISLETSGDLSTSDVPEVSNSSLSSAALASSAFTEKMPSIKAVSSKIVGIGKPWIIEEAPGHLEEVFEEGVSALRIVDDDDDDYDEDIAKSHGRRLHFMDAEISENENNFVDGSLENLQEEVRERYLYSFPIVKLKYILLGCGG
jgi:hypothetical protein